MFIAFMWKARQETTTFVRVDEQRELQCVQKTRKPCFSSYCESKVDPATPAADHSLIRSILFERERERERERSD